MFRRGKELGVNLIDTAECYGHHTSEALIGNAMKSDRKDWIVATKFGHVFHGNFNRTDERTAADAVKQLEESLKALRTDYVDILQYHSIRNEEFDYADYCAFLTGWAAGGTPGRCTPRGRRSCRRRGRAGSRDDRGAAVDARGESGTDARQVKVVTKVLGRHRPAKEAAPRTWAKGPTD